MTSAPNIRVVKLTFHVSSDLQGESLEIRARVRYNTLHIVNVETPHL
jgi:hypothetical protein